MKAVAYSRGFELKGEQDVKRYTASLAREFKGKGIGDAFDQLCSFSAAAYEYQDARFGRVQLRNLAGRVSSTVEILWKMLPQHEGDLLLG